MDEAQLSGQVLPSWGEGGEGGGEGIQVGGVELAVPGEN